MAKFLIGAIAITALLVLGLVGSEPGYLGPSRPFNPTRRLAPILYRLLA